MMYISFKINSKHYRINVYLLIIVFVATILRLYKLNFQSFWLDELYTMNVTHPSNSFATVITEVNNKEGFPYLYFIIINFLHKISYSPIVARGVSALFGILCVIAVYKLGDKIYNKTVGLYAALLLGLNDYCIFISQDARPYTIYLFFVILSYAALIQYLKFPSRKNAIYYSIVAGLLLNFNFFSLINVFAQAIIIILNFLIIAKENRKEYLKNTSILAVIGLLFFIPNIFKLTTLISFKSTWIPAPTNESLTIILKEFIGNSEITVFFFTPLYIYFLFVIFKTKQVNKWQNVLTDKKTFLFIILFSWLVAYLAIVSVKSYLDTSIYVTRYFTSLLPVIIIIVSVSFAFINNRIVRRVYLLGTIGFMLFNLIVVKRYYTSSSKTQFREAAQIITDNNKKNEPVYTSLKYWYDYYLNTDKIKTNVLEKQSLEQVISEMRANPQTIKSFWYTDAHGRPFTITEQAQQFIAQHFYVAQSFDGLDAWTRHYVIHKEMPDMVSLNLDKFKPLQPYNGDSFLYSIENFAINNGVATVTGWAYFDKYNAKNSDISVVLIKDSKIIKVITQRINRPDVTSYFKSDEDISNSGFSSTIEISDLSSGNYSVGVYIANSEIKKEGLAISSNTISK